MAKRPWFAIHGLGTVTVDATSIVQAAASCMWICEQAVDYLRKVKLPLWEDGEEGKHCLKTLGMQTIGQAIQIVMKIATCVLREVAWIPKG